MERGAWAAGVCLQARKERPVCARVCVQAGDRMQCIIPFLLNAYVFDGPGRGGVLLEKQSH